MFWGILSEMHTQIYLLFSIPPKQMKFRSQMHLEAKNPKNSETAWFNYLSVYVKRQGLWKANPLLWRGENIPPSLLLQMAMKRKSHRKTPAITGLKIQIIGQVSLTNILKICLKVITEYGRKPRGINGLLL